jgi:hypothetical protein
MLCLTISVEHNINRAKTEQQLCSIDVLFNKYRIVKIRISQT